MLRAILPWVRPSSRASDHFDMLVSQAPLVSDAEQVQKVASAFNTAMPLNSVIRTGSKWNRCQPDDNSVPTAVIHAMVTLAHRATSPDSVSEVASALGRITLSGDATLHPDPVCATQVRDALVALAACATTSVSAKSVAAAFRCLLTNDSLRLLFCTDGVLQSLVSLAQRAESSECAEEVAAALCNAVFDHASRKCFGTAQVRDALVALAACAQTPQSAFAVARALCLFLSSSNPLFSSPAVQAALVSMTRTVTATKRREGSVIAAWRALLTTLHSQGNALPLVVTVEVIDTLLSLPSLAATGADAENIVAAYSLIDLSTRAAEFQSALVSLIRFTTSPDGAAGLAAALPRVVLMNPDSWSSPEATNVVMDALISLANMATTVAAASSISVAVSQLLPCAHNAGVLMFQTVADVHGALVSLAARVATDESVNCVEHITLAILSVMRCVPSHDSFWSETTVEVTRDVLVALGSGGATSSDSASSIAAALVLMMTHAKGEIVRHLMSTSVVLRVLVRLAHRVTADCDACQVATALTFLFPEGGSSGGSSVRVTSGVYQALIALARCVASDGTAMIVGKALVGMFAATTATVDWSDALQDAFYTLCQFAATGPCASWVSRAIVMSLDHYPYHVTAAGSGHRLLIVSLRSMVASCGIDATTTKAVATVMKRLTQSYMLARMSATQDVLVSLSHSAVTAESAQAVADVLDAVCRWDGMPKSFSTDAVRDGLIALAHRISDPAGAEGIAAVFRRLAAISNRNDLLLSTRPVRDALVALGAHACVAEPLNLIAASDRSLFATVPVRDTLVMWATKYAAEPIGDRHAAVCATVSMLSFLTSNCSMCQTLFGTLDVRDGLVALTPHVLTCGTAAMADLAAVFCNLTESIPANQALFGTAAVRCAMFSIANSSKLDIVSYRLSLLALSNVKFTLEFNEWGAPQIPFFAVNQRDAFPPVTAVCMTQSTTHKRLDRVSLSGLESFFGCDVDFLHGARKIRCIHLAPLEAWCTIGDRFLRDCSELQSLQL